MMIKRHEKINVIRGSGGRTAVRPYMRIALPLLLMALLAGCALRPAGEKTERTAIDRAGEAYSSAPAPLPESPTVEDYLQFAFLNNGDLESQYWQWRAAIEQVPQVSSFPRLMLTYDVMFSTENMSLWDRSTVGLGNDSMEAIPFPTKLKTRGKIALENARAAGERFAQMKFLLQQQVRNTWYDISFLAEGLRIQQENVALLTMISGQASARVRTGSASQQDLLRAQTNVDLARNELENLQSQLPGLVARMNALLGRSTDAPVPLPGELPAPRPLPVSDDELLRIGAERSPELAAFSRQIAGREQALSLAKQAWLPDFNLSGSITGDATQALGAMVMLPTRIEAIKGGIAEARANIRAVEAAREQYERDLAASFVFNLYVLRNDERQAALFEKTIIPRAEQTVAVAATDYANNRLSFADLLETQRTLLDARLVLAQLRIEREKALAAIETWSTVDVQAMPRARMAAQGGPSGSGMNGMGSPASGGASGPGM